jgi:hypothetical protein
MWLKAFINHDVSNVLKSEGRSKMFTLGRCITLTSCFFRGRQRAKHLHYQASAGKKRGRTCGGIVNMKKQGRSN